MIRIGLPVGRSLEDLVDAFNPNWRIDNLVWDGISSPWSDIKSVFVGLQFGKCAYCERLVQASLNENKIESDIEHYRPKKKTVTWSCLGYKLKAGLVSGYGWLATDVANYLLSCKTCNSHHKKNYFPIAGLVGRVGQSVDVLNTFERPLLLHPIDPLDDDPEDLIDWVGFVPIPKILESADAFRFQRAKISIEFFKLDLRADVRRGCAEQIRLIWSRFQLLGVADRSEVKQARAFLESCKTDSKMTHAACGRAFLKLIARDPIEAKQVVLAAENYLAEMPALFGQRI